MCQLLGLSGSTPAAIAPFFPEFFARGGGTDRHRDGWGAAFFEPGNEDRALIFRDARPAFESPASTELVQAAPLARFALAHVRAASVEPPAISNTHPFALRAFGRDFAFAHNGWLREYGPGFSPELPAPYAPTGRTDSEYVFGVLMMALEDSGLDPGSDPERAAALLIETCAPISPCGDLNFLLCDGRFLWARACSDLWRGYTPSGSLLIATQPLAGAFGWIRLEPGSIHAFADGHAVASRI